MTLVDRLCEEEGEKEGINGMKEGMREELVDILAVLLNRKLEMEEIIIDSKIKPLDIKIRDNIFKISSLEDLGEYVN